MGNNKELNRDGKVKTSDGRKNNRGTIGNKGGRPVKNVGQRFQQLVERENIDEAYKELRRLAFEEGDRKMFELYLAYTIGKPVVTQVNVNQDIKSDEFKAIWLTESEDGTITDAFGKEVKEYNNDEEE